MIRLFCFDDLLEFDDIQQVTAWKEMFPSMYKYDETNLRIEYEQAGVDTTSTG